jgi:hypothetical protein
MLARRRLAGHHVMLVVRRPGHYVVEVARPARARRAVLHVQPKAAAAGRSLPGSRAALVTVARGLGELGGEGEDLPVRQEVELDLADQATLAVGEDGRAAHRVALEGA